jgi:amino acid permease
MSGRMSEDDSNMEMEKPVSGLMSNFDGITAPGEAARSDAVPHKDDINDKVEHVLPGVLQASHAPTQNSKPFIAFLLLNTMIGSGILNQPEVFLKAGIVGALSIFAVAGTFVWIGLACLLACGIEFHKTDYSELSEFAFGVWGEKLVDIMIVLNNFGALLSYLIVVGGTATELFWEWGCDSQGCNVYYSTSMATIFVLMPVCSLRYFGHLTYISVFSVLSIAAVLGLVLIGGPIVGNGSNPVVFNGSGGLRKFGSVVFALSCAPASFHAYKSMAHKSTKDWNQVSATAVISGAIMCITMGLGKEFSAIYLLK